MRVPPFQMPPPPLLPATLPEMVELEMLRVPLLEKPPPWLEVFAPETVTPEMVRLPPASMLKILKSRPPMPLLPLMVREEEPSPLMVRVPAVPPVIGVLALIMVGSEALTVLLRESRVIVPVMLKLMMSSPAVVLASIIACRRVPAPESALEETVMVTGLMRCSRPRSSSLRK